MAGYCCAAANARGINLIPLLSTFAHWSPASLCPDYRGAMGILLVYDVTDEASFNNIRNWMKNIEQHASESVVKVRQQ